MKTIHFGAAIFACLLILTLSCSSGVKRVLYINSYHVGLKVSDDCFAGIQETFARQDNVLLDTIEMDTKRNREPEFIQKKVEEVLDKIKSYKPHLILVSDDNAVKHVVVPHLLGKKTPVVFCGVNWSAEEYGVPAENVAGVLEIFPIESAIRHLKKYYPDAKKLHVLAENSVTEKRNQRFIRPIFQRLGMEVMVSLVNSAEAWQTAFVEANQSADIIYLANNMGIRNWDDAEMRRFVENEIQKPVFTTDEFMMPYCSVGFAKLQKEQGTRAAQMGLKVLMGVRPSELPLEKNSEVQFYLNPRLSRRIQFQPDNSFLIVSQIVS